MLELPLLFLAAMVAGSMNALAGGGTFIVFPSLLFAGVSPIAANATATVTVWPGSLASVYGYRRELSLEGAAIPPLIAASFLGALAGALILLATPERIFTGLIPWLLLGATFLFSFGGRIVTRIHAYVEAHPHYARSHRIATWCMQFIIALYGGYFGAGIGILMLAMLELSGMKDIHRMNALKTVLGSAINFIAVVTFVLAGIISWQHAPLMITGAILGGYLGAHYGRRLPQIWVRRMVIFIGTVLTAHFFWRS